MALLATALMCTAMSAGCGGPPVAEVPPPVPSVAKFALSYERSGGLAADPRSLQISPGRHAIAKRRRLPAASDTTFTRRFRIGVTQIKRLRAALERADFTSIGTPGPNPGVCADCYFYAIEYREHEVSFSQVEVPERLRPVVARLEAIVNAH
jgi:hypothetical protein